ncbi:MAG TPA: dihydropteroate synthase [Spirochaetota bacterium]|nr:dihydropteroate synthase [Spirochaetota bacterium]
MPSLKGKVEPEMSFPLVMGIINVTPDSFWEGSRRPDVAAAVQAARTMQKAGAALIDVGGESTRPGSRPVSIEEEEARVVPVIRALVDEPGLVVSIDTRHPEVAEAALAAGAAIINDVGGLGDPEMRALAADSGARVILMHMQGQPETMQEAPQYRDVLAEIDGFFSTRLDLAVAAGIRRERVWLDPGIGFGKRLEDNLAIIRGLGRFSRHGCPLVMGLSRKSFIGAVTGRPVEERILGTCLYHYAALTAGAAILRVHDVPEAMETISVWRSLQEEQPGKIPTKAVFSP